MARGQVRLRPGDANYSETTAYRLYYDCTSLAHGVPTNTSAAPLAIRASGNHPRGPARNIYRCESPRTRFPALG
jgi:hypothetical protein